MEGYLHCLNQCSAVILGSKDASQQQSSDLMIIQELRGEVMLRIAVLKKDLGAFDQALVMCNHLCVDHACSEYLRANALCLKASSLLLC
jgi:hypothetical protein